MKKKRINPVFIFFSCGCIAALFLMACQKNILQPKLDLELATAGIPSSAAVPKGMELFWQDEFNDGQLDRTKWSTNYYSTYDLPGWGVTVNSRPQPIMNFTDSSIILLGQGRISSIQTYDWGSDQNFLDNSRGGYFEVRVRRSKLTPSTSIPNTAFWLDAPGPDLKRYMEEGKTAYGVTGVRPRGQLFEVDVFELLDARFNMFGNVDPNGKLQSLFVREPDNGYVHEDTWVTHGVLWGAGIVSHYINGNLINNYTDKSTMRSPNHFMNVLLGAYNNGKMEVDYIRGYRWPLIGGNELPNPGFDINTSKLPWEGNATLSTTIKYSGSAALKLTADQSITQYLYLDNNTNYQLRYWMQGTGDLEAKVENIKAVVGTTTSTFSKISSGGSVFASDVLDLKTESMYGTDLKVVKVTFTNVGSDVIILDNISLTKGGSGGVVSVGYCSASEGSGVTADRYITSLSTANAIHNITYSRNVKPANGYTYYRADSLVVAPGSTFNLNMNNTPDTKWSRIKVYVDWNGNNDFVSAGEDVLSLGNGSQDNSSTVLNVSRNITVPATAKIGKTRMRIRFYDAWGSDPGPCGVVQRTTTHDFTVVIKDGPVIPLYCSASDGTIATGPRYITSLSTVNALHNITYTNNVRPANGYNYFTADSITVSPGSTFTLKMNNTSDTKWSRVKVYVDWNGNGDFVGAGESVLSLGNGSQDNSASVLNISSNITIPSTAKTGKTRMRIRFYDAWGSDPGPCGQADRTTTQDFIISVQ
ncbi:glycoside hydrolase family 16 protein [Sphingobacterium spiritivorum]|uniref:glycoside hydrolase family 16 protein n=1 Tax=Sphingobacterium spiritivorum TaxID=258 RepID=UPI003DA63E78